jgi:hypothetical protein
VVSAYRVQEAVPGEECPELEDDAQGRNAQETSGFLTFLLKLSPKGNVKGGANRNGLGSDLTLAYDSAPGSSAAERKVRGFHSRSETDEGEPLQNESIFFSPVFFFFLLLEISLSLARVEAELELAAVSPPDEAAPC